MTPTRSSRIRFPRAALIGAAALAIALAGAGAAQASWSTFGSTTASVASGTVSVSQSGFALLAIDYTSNTRSTVTPVTVVNGNVPASYSAVLGVASGTGALASNVVVRTWTTVTGSCAGAIPTGATTGTWTSGTKPLTGNLAPGGSVTYCVSTTLPTDKLSTSTKQTVTAQLSLSAVVAGSAWKTAVTTVTALQTLTDNVAPQSPGAPCINSVTDASITMDWRAPEGGNLTYKVYRDGGTDAVGTATSNTAGAMVVFTDTKLSVGSTHSYTVKAVDSFGNTSVASAATQASTNSMPSANTWYQVKNGTQCLTGGATSGSALTLQDCTAATNQLWRYVMRDGYSYSILNSGSNLAWTRSTAGVTAQTYDANSAAQRWWGGPNGGGQFTVSDNNGQYLTVKSSTSLVMQAWSTAGSQLFTVWRVG